MTYVLNLGTCLANDGGFEAHARTGIPPENGEGTRASSTRATKLLLGLYGSTEFRTHSNEGVCVPCERKDYHPGL